MEHRDQKTKLLIVDDDPGQRELFRAIFLRDPYEILEAEDGADGIEVAIDRLPQLIVADFRMPGMSGLDFIKATRAHPRLRHIPLVISTSAPSSLQGFECIRSGATDYYPKPLDPAPFRRKVKTLIGHPIDGE